MASTAAGDASQFWTAFRHQSLFYVRTNRFLGLLLVSCALSAVVLAFDLHSGTAAVRAANPTVSAYLQSYLGNLGFDVGLVAAFFGGDAIARDFGSATGYYTLVLPVRRTVLLLGRYMAAFLVSFGVVLAYYAFAAASAAYFYGTLPLALAASVGLAALLTLATLALAFFFSSLFRNPAVSMIVTVLLLWIVLPSITGSVGELGGIEPWASLSYAGNVVTLVFAASYAHASVMTVGPLTIHVFNPYIGEGIAIMVGYLLIFLGIAGVLYRYKEVRG
jgi:ABC-2 type transport system permease protein